LWQRTRSVEATNISYWVMRMTDLAYILIQRWHEHLTNEELESAMVELPYPSWEDPESIRALFDRMRNIWSRVDPSRRALSLLEDKMLRVVRFNRDYGPSIKAEYDARRREAMREEMSRQHHDWESSRAAAANWVPSADIQMSLWDKVANRIAAEEVVYVVPPDRIERFQTHDKKAAVPPKKVSSVVQSSGESSVTNADLLQRMEEMLATWQPPGGQNHLHEHPVSKVHAAFERRNYVTCENCGGRHFDDDKHVNAKCPRRVNGKWIPAAFIALTPRRMRMGDYSQYPQYSSIVEFWKRNMPKFYPLFNKETEAVKEEFFKKLKEEETRHTRGSSQPAAATSAPKKVMSAMRIVNMSRPREATEEDTLAMYRVSYLNSSGMSTQGGSSLILAP
jgi:hypothetical protein